MIFLTHLAFALLIGIFWTHTFNPIIPAWQFIAVLLFASLFPDIDIGTSMVGRHFKVINFFLEHRGIVHSIFFMTICAIAIAVYFAPVYALPFVLGFISHLVLDAMNHSGVRAFWPSTLRTRGIFKSGGLFDFILFGLLLIASLALVNHYSGNIFTSWI